MKKQMSKEAFENILNDFKPKFPEILEKVNIIIAEIVNTGKFQRPSGIVRYRHEWMRWHLMKLARDHGLDAWPEQSLGSYKVHYKQYKMRTAKGFLDVAWWIMEEHRFAKARALVAWEIDTYEPKIKSIAKLIEFPAPFGIHICLLKTIPNEQRLQIIKQPLEDNSLWIAPAWKDKVPLLRSMAKG